MILNTGLPFEAFKVEDVKIDEEGTVIRTVSVGDPSKPKMVLVHGFGGTWVIWFKIVQRLAERYYLIMVDAICCGVSSKPDIGNVREVDQGVDFLVGWMEKWRVAMGNLTDFILMAHSFGAYNSGLWAAAHQEHVKHLVLLSPFGVPCKPEGYYYMDDVNRFPADRRPADFVFKLRGLIWKAKFTPFKMMRMKLMPSFVTKYFVNYFARKRMQMAKFSPSELADYKAYLFEVLSRAGGYDDLLFVLFDTDAFPHRPLQAELGNGRLRVPSPSSSATTTG